MDPAELDAVIADRVAHPFQAMIMVTDEQFLRLCICDFAKNLSESLKAINKLADKRGIQWTW